jgi:hypothetical protein
VAGDRQLDLFAYVISALPHIVFIHLTTAVSRHYVRRWLRDQPPASFVAAPALMTEHADRLDAIVQHVVSTWWALDLFGGRHDR